MAADLRWFIGKYFFSMNGFANSEEEMIQYVKDGRFTMDEKIMTLDDLNLVPNDRVKIELTYEDGSTDWYIY